MKKAAIVLDKWKLPIFERHIEQAGYAFETADGVTDDTTSLIVHTDNLTALGEVVKDANTEAAMTGATKCAKPH